MPVGSMRKYFEDNGGSQHNGPIHWPGTADGFPFRGGSGPPNLKQSEYESIPLALDYHSALFVLSDESQKAEFERVMDRIVNGWYMQHKRIDRWNDNPPGPVVWLEWVQIYGEAPNGKNPNAKATNATGVAE